MKGEMELSAIESRPYLFTDWDILEVCFIWVKPWCEKLEIEDSLKFLVFVCFFEYAKERFLSDGFGKGLLLDELGYKSKNTPLAKKLFDALNRENDSKDLSFDSYDEIKSFLSKPLCLFDPFWVKAVYERYADEVYFIFFPKRMSLTDLNELIEEFVFVEQSGLNWELRSSLFNLTSGCTSEDLLKEKEDQIVDEFRAFLNAHKKQRKSLILSSVELGDSNRNITDDFVAEVKNLRSFEHPYEENIIRRGKIKDSSKRLGKYQVFMRYLNELGAYRVLQAFEAAIKTDHDLKLCPSCLGTERNYREWAFSNSNNLNCGEFGYGTVYSDRSNWFPHLRAKNGLPSIEGSVLRRMDEFFPD